MLVWMDAMVDDLSYNILDHSIFSQDFLIFFGISVLRVYNLNVDTVFYRIIQGFYSKFIFCTEKTAENYRNPIDIDFIQVELQILWFCFNSDR